MASRVGRSRQLLTNNRNYARRIGEVVAPVVGRKVTRCGDSFGRDVTGDQGSMSALTVDEHTSRVANIYSEYRRRQRKKTLKGKQERRREEVDLGAARQSCDFCRLRERLRQRSAQVRHKAAGKMQFVHEGKEDIHTVTTAGRQVWYVRLSRSQTKSDADAPAPRLTRVLATDKRSQLAAQGRPHPVIDLR